MATLSTSSFPRSWLATADVSLAGYHNGTRQAGNQRATGPASAPFASRLE
jgi:hypothetical protein